MELVENTLRVEVDDFLERPLFCFLGQVDEDGPRVSPLWFQWEDGALWIIAQVGRSYLERIEWDPRVAVAVVDYEPTAGRVEHVGIRGYATVEPFDVSRANRLLRRYLGADRADWDDRFVGLDGTEYRFVRIEPVSAVARDRSYAPPNGEGITR